MTKKVSKRIDVTVVIANYNSVQVLTECLGHLRELELEEQTIVVDNASTDETVATVMSKFPKVNLIQLNQNRGISYAYNQALKLIKTKYVLFMGSDAFPDPETIPFLEKYMDKNPDVGIATSKLVTRSGELDMDSHRGFPTPLVSFLHFSKISSDKYFLKDRNMNDIHEIDACISHFMLVSRKVCELVKGFDEDYFVYGEDIDFCYRVKKVGFKVMYVPAVKTLHYKGVSVGIRKESRDITKASKETRLKMANFSTVAMEIFFRKHYQNQYPFLVSVFVIFAIRVLKFIRVLKIKIS